MTKNKTTLGDIETGEIDFGAEDEFSLFKADTIYRERTGMHYPGAMKATVGEAIAFGLILVEVDNEEEAYQRHLEEQSEPCLMQVIVRQGPMLGYACCQLERGHDGPCKA